MRHSSWLRWRRKLAFKPKWNGSRAELLQQLHQRRVVTQIVSRLSGRRNKQERRKINIIRRINFHKKQQKSFSSFSYAKTQENVEAKPAKQNRVENLKMMKNFSYAAVAEESMLLCTQIVWMKNKITRKKDRAIKTFFSFSFPPAKCHEAEKLFIFLFLSGGKFQGGKTRAKRDTRERRKKVMQI